MHPSELGGQLVKSLKAQPDLDITTEDSPLIVFVGVNAHSVRRWFTGKYPRGHTLNKLWYFLDAIGVETPRPSEEKTDRVELRYYLGKLLAFDVITLPQAAAMMHINPEQRTYNFIRGDFSPEREQPTLDDLKQRFNQDLDAALDMWEENLSKARAAIKPVRRKDDSPQPSDDESVGSDDTGKPDVAPTPSDASVPPTGSAPSGAPPMHPQKLSPPGDDQPLAGRITPTVPALTDLDEPDSKATPEQRFELAAKLTDLIPWIKRALNEWTEEDRAAVRSYIGDDAFFALTTEMNRMSGRRAFTIGRNRTSD